MQLLEVFLSDIVVVTPICLAHMFHDRLIETSINLLT